MDHCLPILQQKPIMDNCQNVLNLVDGIRTDEL